MAKKKTPFTLMLGRTQPFRRTVHYGSGKNAKSAQLVFEPGVDVDLDAEELEQCEDLIATGLLVPADRDAKGRLRMSREAPAGAEAKIEELEKKVERLAEENEGLKCRLAEWEALEEHDSGA